MFFSRGLATSSPALNGAQTKAPSRKWLRRFGAAGVIWAGLFVADTLLNDEVDVVFTDKFRSKVPEEERKKRPKVVVLGSGWGALSMIRKLHADAFQVTIVSPRNYFLFTPLLASTTVGTLHQRSIVEPIRQFCLRSDAAEAKFIEAECTEVDFAKRKVKCVDNSSVQGSLTEFDLDYDHLVIAVGAESATFNIPGVKEHAIFMKEIKHSYSIRDKILDCLETANIPGQPDDEIDRLLHFVVVGGGPSGIEFSAELHDFLKADVTKNYPEQSKRVKLTLVEALPHVLTMFDASLINETERAFQRQNIQLLLNAQVKAVEEKRMLIKKKDGTEFYMPFGALVWVTGNTPRKLVRDAIVQIGPQFQNDKRGLKVDTHFRVLGAKNVWSIGDCAVSTCPPTAQVAYQQGTYLGRLFNSLSDDFYRAKEDPSKVDLDGVVSAAPSFVYRHFASLAYIGEHQAIAQMSVGQDRKNVDFYGQSVFWLWRSVYFSKLLSYKNRFMVS
jgi:NADH:ubiquinone reductase (non-electrogenic)